MICDCKLASDAMLGRLEGDCMFAAVMRSLNWAKFKESGRPTNIWTTLSIFCQLANWPEFFISRCMATAPDNSRSELSLVEPVNRKSINPHHIIARKYLWRRGEVV